MNYSTLKVHKTEERMKRTVLIGNSLYGDIWNNLDVDIKERYMIPHYFIVKDGKVIIHSAFRPSDKEKLYNQLDEILQGN